MKEAEVDALAMQWVNARVAHLLLVHRMMTMEEGDGPKKELVPDGYEPVNVHPECRDHRALLFLHSTSEGRKGPHGECINVKGTSLAYQRWLFAAGPHCTEHIH